MFSFLRYHKSPFLVLLRKIILSLIKKLFPNKYFFLIFKLRYFIKFLILSIYYFSPKKSLSKTFLYVGSDKYYNYRDLYDIVQYLLPKKKCKKILEIGIGGHDIPFGGGQSLRALNFFYSKANIFGMDINNKTFLDGGRIKTIIGDQSDQMQLNEVANTFGPFDLIIDDGSHFVSHQKKTFQTFFNSLNDNGIYICEDCSSSYVNSFEGDPNLSEEKNIIQYFSKFVHAVNSEYLAKEKLDTLNNFKMITKILFFKGAVLIQKNIKTNLVPLDYKIQTESLEEYNKRVSIKKNKKGFINIST